DAKHRDAALTHARKHIGLARKAHEWFAIAYKDREFGRFCQRLLDHRWQAGAQGHRIALSVLEALHAKLLVIGRNCRAIHSCDRDKRREVRTASGQFFRELETGAW